MIHHGDLFDVLPTLDAESIEACVTDPPYGIGFMGREWDTFKPGEGAKRIVVNRAIESENPNLKGRTRGPASSPSAVEYDYSVKGLRAFQQWTSEWAGEVFRVLKPGAHLLVCGAPRSFHRMACGIEDAGFEIRDCFSWLFGQGFPKSLDISKAIDRSVGAAREVVGMKRGKGGENLNTLSRDGNDATDAKGCGAYGQGARQIDIDIPVTAPATDEARLWVGWGTALKPGWEPIIVARKPIRGTVAANVLKHGTGAINIDACRLEPMSPDDPSRRGLGYGYTKAGDDTSTMYGPKVRSAYDDSLGRWPANVLLDEESAALLDAQSGELGGGGYPSARGQGGMWSGHAGQDLGARVATEGGGASRFYYVSKPSREERDLGCHDLPLRPRDESRKEGSPGGDNPRNRGLQPRGNIHPTVKPIALMRWLVRLVTPIDGTVLDPFTGSGTTGIAAVLEQRNFIGIEREAQYVAIADRRVHAAAPLFYQPASRREWEESNDAEAKARENA